MKVEELAAVVDDLVEVLHLQARELEKLIAHVEQVTAHMREGNQLSVIRSTLSGLHVRIRELRGMEPVDPWEQEKGRATSSGN